MHCMTYDLKFLSAFNCYSNVFLLLTPTHRLAFIIKCNRIMIHKKKRFWKIMVLISDKVWMTVTLHFGEFLQLIYIPMHLILRVLHLQNYPFLFSSSDKTFINMLILLTKQQLQQQNKKKRKKCYRQCISLLLSSNTYINTLTVCFRHTSIII